jgi:hypothetical protein
LRYSVLKRKGSKGGSIKTGKFSVFSLKHRYKVEKKGECKRRV